MESIQILLDKIQYLIENNTSQTIGVNELKNIFNDLSNIQIDQQSEINRLSERENHLKYSLDNALKQNEFHESERKKHIEEIKIKDEHIKVLESKINRLEEEKTKLCIDLLRHLESYDLSNSMIMHDKDIIVDDFLSQNK